MRPIALYETVNLGRTGEPVEARLKFHPAQLTDPYRELRVAQIHLGTGLLSEVPSQVTRTTRTGEVWQCRVLFMADVPAHGEAGYLIFHGNALAELPEYVTDLRVQGEGHDLTISNHYYHARLSRQMGQLERLTYRREHGLELYAGGKGHGEPPGIDWRTTTSMQGQFQKLRINGQLGDVTPETSSASARSERPLLQPKSGESTWDTSTTSGCAVVHVIVTMPASRPPGARLPRHPRRRPGQRGHPRAGAQARRRPRRGRRPDVEPAVDRIAAERRRAATNWVWGL